MNYFRSVVRSTYEKYIEDDFLQPMTQEEIYLIMQKHSERRERMKKGRITINGEAINGTSHEDEADPAAKQQLLESLSHDYELDCVFRSLSSECRLEELEQLIRLLKEKLDDIRLHICNNHLSYLNSIQLSLIEADQVVVRSQATRPQLARLREHLRKLEQSRGQSEKVMQLRVRVNNIKSLLTLLVQMPDLNRLRVKELRGLQLPARIKDLNCYSGLSQFIQHQIDGENERQLSDLRSVLEVFDASRYWLLLVRFFEAETPGMELDKLILGVARELIRQFDVDIYQLCQTYVRFMINFHLICRWHHEYQPQTDPDLPKEPLQKLRTAVFQMRRKLWTMMEEHVQHLLSELIEVDGERLLELTCQLNRFIEIGENFGGAHIGKIGEELFLKSVSMIHSTVDDGLSTVSESLIMEESVEWSRLPVENQYHYQQLESALLAIGRMAELPLYKEFTRNNLCFVDVNEKRLQNPDQDWSFVKFRLDMPTDAVRLRRLPTNITPCRIGDEVVICQSVLPVLRFYEQCTKELFNLRLVSDKLLNAMYFVTDYYAYYVFMTFLTSRQPLAAANTPEERYEKDRFERRYPVLSQFLRDFKNELSQTVSSQLGAIKPSRQQKKLLRSRVVSIESFRYMCAYLEFCLTNLRRIVGGVDRNWPRIEDKLTRYEKLHKEMGQVLYRDCLTKIAVTEFLLSPFLKVRWEQEVDLEPLRLSLEVFIKDFHKKLKGLGKGQIPVAITIRIFHLFCKHMTQALCETYLRIRKMTQDGRTHFKNMLAKLQKEMCIFFDGQEQHFTTGLSELVTATGSEAWAELLAYAQKCAQQYELSYREMTTLAIISRCADLATKTEIQKREAELIELARTADNL